MTQMHTGIILRAPTVPTQAVPVLDSEFGKIEAYVNGRMALSHGTVIEYYPVARGSRYRLQGGVVVQVPLAWANEHLIFFHHVLELCDHLVPWSAHCPGLYRLLSVLYTKPTLVACKKAQKRFLQAFFKQIGLTGDVHQLMYEYPELQSLKTAQYLTSLE